VLGFSDLLLRRLGPNDPTSGDLEQIRRAAGRAATITGQLLAFSRRQMFRPEVLDLNQLVRGLEPMLRQVFGEDRTFTTELAPDLFPVRTDPGHMEQVLINLALNARDALSSGGKVWVRTRNEVVRPPPGGAGNVDGPQPGEYTVLSVSDTGHGMDAATRARVFEPFFTTKPVGQGTGLGLATVFGIVRQSGGSVHVETAPGQGSTFSVYLPAVPRAAPPPESSSAEGAGRGSETVLIVEDEEMVRNFVCRYLEAQGYRCIEASNGRQALEVLERRGSEVDAIVTDVVMPLMGGRELTERVDALRPGTPFLFISAHTGDEIVRRGLMEPGTPFLQKPFTPQALAASIREILDRRASSDAGDL
jgi:two-component system cell cycle sensor histidine kinase/response regulator CckA